MIRPCQRLACDSVSMCLVGKLQIFQWMKVIPLLGYSVTLYFAFYCFPSCMVGVATLSLVCMIDFSMSAECKSFHATFCPLRVLCTTTTTIITTNTLYKTASGKWSCVSEWNGERRNCACACNSFLQGRIYPWRKGHTDLHWIWKMGWRSANLHWWANFSFQVKRVCVPYWSGN